MVLDDAKRADACVNIFLSCFAFQITMISRAACWFHFSLCIPSHVAAFLAIHANVSRVNCSWVDSVEQDANAATGPLTGAFSN